MIMNKSPLTPLFQRGGLKALLVITTAFILTSCIIDTKHSPADLHKQLVKNKPSLTRPLPRSYLRPVSKKEILRAQKVTYSNPSVSLLEVLTTVLPQYNIIPNDPGVEMALPLAISVTGLSLSKFLDYLEGLTGYGILLKQNTITISSRVTKQWNLSALASLREHEARVGQTISAITEGAEGKEEVASTTTKFDNSSKRAFHDQWDLLLKSARAIIGAPEKANFIPTFPVMTEEDTPTAFGLPAAYSASAPPFVVGNRSMGILLASGEPRRIKILDQYIVNLERASSSQVNIDVKTFDVTLTDDRAAGIDWRALRENTKWNFDITSPATAAWNPSITATNLWSGIVNYKKGNNDIKATIRFLEQYGKVQLLNEPNVTVLNGTTAYLSSGDEFSFISDLEQRQDGSPAAKIVVTPKFSRIRVGVTMAVTPRLLEGDKVLLDIVPVVSSLQGFDKIQVAGTDETQALSAIDTPKIALQELSTQVIARSGETIQLGGLMYKKIGEALTRIPTKISPLTKLLDLAFKSDTNTLQRRELVLLVTPTLIESKKWSP